MDMRGRCQELHHTGTDVIAPSGPAGLPSLHSAHAEGSPGFPSAHAEGSDRVEAYISELGATSREERNLKVVSPWDSVRETLKQINPNRGNLPCPYKYYLLHFRVQLSKLLSIASLARG